MKNKMSKLMYIFIGLAIVFNCNANISKFESDRQKISSFNLRSNNGGIQFVTVGNDINCDYQIGFDTLQDAIDAIPAEIRLATNAQYNGITIESTSINIIGGFDDCQAAGGNLVGLNKSIINGSIQNNIPAVDVIDSNINFSNLILQNGSVGLSATQGGAIFNLDNVIIQNNNNSASTTPGSGIILNIILNAFFRDVRITNNQATAGAGIYCVGRTLTIVGESSIDNNVAIAGSGGGIYATNCDINFVGGSNSNNLNGLSNNTSSLSGGGVFLLNSSVLTITGGLWLFENTIYGDLSQPFQINDNFADGAGGGVFSSGSFANLINVSMINNRSLSSGGAVYGQSNSTINIFRSDEKCRSDMSCNYFSENKANDFGGTIYVNGGTNLNLAASRITKSRSDDATVLFVGGSNSVANVESSIFYNNGSSIIDNFSDREVIKVNNTATLNLKQSTIVDNNAINSAIDIVGSTADIKNSYVYNPNIPNYVTMSGNSFESSSCLFVDDNNSASGSVEVITDLEYMQSFVDVVSSNFHLSSDSIAIDKCLTAGVIKDIDGDNFDYDAENLNGSGLVIYDIGADEEVGIIFVNGFES